MDKDNDVQVDKDNQKQTPFPWCPLTLHCSDAEQVEKAWQIEGQGEQPALEALKCRGDQSGALGGESRG